MDLTINQGGTFTSTGANVNITLTSGVDWMRVRNITQAAASQTTALAVEFYWQKSSAFAAGSQYAYLKSNAAAAANLIQYQTTGGFTLVDSSVQTPGALISTITAISNASIPVVTNTGTNGLSAGAVVRLINVAGCTQYSGIEFTVGYNTLSSTTFSLDYAPQIVAGTTGSWRVISYGPYYYPSNYTVASISKASQAVVVTTVEHNLTVGQAVRFSNVSSAMGMPEINGLVGNIVAVNLSATVNSFTVDINTTAFTTLAWPLTASAAFTPCVVVPVGMDTSLAIADGVNILSDATVNDAYVGMTLTGGAGYPGGANNDVLVWEAGTFFANTQYGD